MKKSIILKVFPLIALIAAVAMWQLGVNTPLAEAKKDKAAETSQAAAKKEDVWHYRCKSVSEENEEQKCWIEQSLFVSQGEGEEKTRKQLLSIKLTDSAEEEKYFMSVSMPLGVDLRSGMVFKVDENDEINLPFTMCVQSGCQAGSLVDSDIVSQMKSGKEITVGFRPFGSDKTVAIPASLIGFTKSFRKLS